jgi:hypothetical protein
LGSFEFGFKGHYARIGHRQSICSTEKGKESRIKKQRKIHETGKRHNTGKKITLRSSSSFQKFDTFRAQRDNFFIKICQKKDMSRKVQAMNKEKTPGLILTSS